MPSLVAGYRPPAIPPPAHAGTGLVADDQAGPMRDPERPDSTMYLGTSAPVHAPGVTGAPELRTPNVPREQYANPAVAYFTRSPHDEDNDAQLHNPRGQHVAQVPGAAVAHGAMDGEPPMYGATWRLDPQTASAGWYIEGS